MSKPLVTSAHNKRRQSRRRSSAHESTKRTFDYHGFHNPYLPLAPLSQDRLVALHETALRVLEEVGIKVLLPEAQTILAHAGAKLVDDMVFIGRDMVNAAIVSAPNTMLLKGGTQQRDIGLIPSRTALQPAGSCPNATDLIRGRRPGSVRDFKELCLLTQHYDVLNFLPPLVEAQDIPTHLRHYAFMETQLTCTDRVPFVFSRGTPQVLDSFEMLTLARGLSDKDFQNHPWCYTVINTNSPRQIDIPMGQGLIDFARYGQMAIITPAGAMTLSHAESLAALTLTQLVKPGAPVCYGTFTSNVDMKSGSPALGTPEQFHANLIAGQLARLLDIPWRSASGSACATADAQAAHETQMGTWGAVLAGANVIMHAAGWLEVGLTVSYEKFITDVEMLQIMVESLGKVNASDEDFGFDAIAQVQPGGHFFDCDQTMARYQTAFYEPIVYDWNNFGTWQERGEKTATQRATDVWRAIVDAGSQVDIGSQATGALQDFVAQRTAEGGAGVIS